MSFVLSVSISLLLDATTLSLCTQLFYLAMRNVVLFQLDNSNTSVVTTAVAVVFFMGKYLRILLLPTLSTTISKIRSKKFFRFLISLLRQKLILTYLLFLLMDQSFIDGSKFEADANKFSFVWRKSAEKNLINLHVKARLFGASRSLPRFSSCSIPSVQDIFLVMNALSEEMTRLDLGFVNGRGKRNSCLKQIQKPPLYI